MPSGRTHDAITFLLTVPAIATSYAIAGQMGTSVLVGVAFLIGGLVFGPDLDTVSRQYSRWSVLRCIWLPYRSFFSHRSRFSHGLIFGALFRVVYFMGVVSVVGLLITAVIAAYSGGQMPTPSNIVAVWRPIGEACHRAFGANFGAVFFVGIWLGAASHTFTDMAGSFIKTGKVAKFL